MQPYFSGLLVPVNKRIIKYLLLMALILAVSCGSNMKLYYVLMDDYLKVDPARSYSISGLSIGSDPYGLYQYKFKETLTGRTIPVTRYPIERLMKINPPVNIILVLEKTGSLVALDTVYRGINGKTVLMSSGKCILTMIDDSAIQGEVVGYNLETGLISFATLVKTFEIEQKNLQSISAYEDKVKLILLDGSFRNGILVKDDGAVVSIKTMLGIETYERAAVIKIEYMNKK